MAVAVQAQTGKLVSRAGEIVGAKRRALMIGAGGWPGVWVRTFIPALADRLDVVGLVDLNEEALNRSADLLGLQADQRFTDIETAFAGADADLVLLCTPPRARLRAVELAAERGLPVLCEKPIADSWQDSLAIYRLAQDAGIKLSVVQNYRYTTRIRTLKRVLDEGRLGQVNYVVCRFAADYTIDTAGGAFRHQIPDAMIYEGAEHHLDMFRHLAGSDVAWISGTQWNRPWSTFGNNCCAMFLIEMENGVIGQYEMTHITRGHETGWHHEHYRVECQKGTVTVDADDVVRITEHLGKGYERVTEVAADETTPADHRAVIAGFLDWLDGGPEPQTAAPDNIRTAALAFAAVEASRTRQVIDVRAMLTEAGIR
ncbi:MAG: Gfo/Idh/MocA family protein [Thermomicrobiales bacterium]